MKEKEMVGGCCVCSDDRGWDENPLVYCDGQGCSVAVHQACYGIVTVPSGPWFCRKCESLERTSRVRCDLCPLRDGALKRTDQNGWAHVVCALYIPEVRFGNVTTMEPILTSLIPPERFNKVCYVCEENNRNAKANIGACMSCNKAGCKQSFHVTCAQMLGLLCEEAGVLMDNVKYCGYCQYHSGKLKNSRNMKLIPPFRPVTGISGSPSPSPEKVNNTESWKNAVNKLQNSEDRSQPSHGNSQSHNSQECTRPVASNSLNSCSSSVQSNYNSKVNSTDIEQLVTGSVTNSRKGSRRSSCSSGSNNSIGGSTGGPNASSVASLNNVPKVVNCSSSRENKDSIANNSDSNINSGSVPSALFNSSGSLFPSSHHNSVSNSGLEHEEHVGKPSKPRLLLKPQADNCSISLERVDEKKLFAQHLNNSSVSSSTLSSASTSSVSGGFMHKKDVTHIHLNESVSTNSAALNSKKFDIHSHSHYKHPSAEKEGLAAKLPPPPDIKPHVTLTPIPPNRGPPLRLSKDEEPLKLSPNCSGPSSLFPANSSRSEAKEFSPELNDVKFRADAVSSEPDASRDRHETPPLKRSRLETSEEPCKHPVTETKDSVANQEGLWTAGKHLESPTGSAKDKDRLKDSLDDDMSSAFSQLSSDPLKPTKRGPGRPPRRTGLTRDEEKDRKVQICKSRGKRGGSNGFSNRSDSSPRIGNGVVEEDKIFDEPMDDLNQGPRRNIQENATASRKPANKEDPPTPTFAQMKQQLRENSCNGASTTVAGTAELPAHMFGNILNPTSDMAQHLVSTFSQEIEEMSPKSQISSSTPLVGVSLPGKPSNQSSQSVSSNNGSSSTPQTLEQLLELHWEQGSQFLMEQAQHLDIAQLLSCLNQLKQDNKALEEHVQSLVQRRDHLMTVNARLSVPLNSTLSTLVPSAGSSSSSNILNHTSSQAQITLPQNASQQSLITMNGGVSTARISRVDSSSPQSQHTQQTHHGRGHSHQSSSVLHHVTKTSVASPHPHQNENVLNIQHQPRFQHSSSSSSAVLYQHNHHSIEAHGSRAEMESRILVNRTHSPQMEGRGGAQVGQGNPHSLVHSHAHGHSLSRHSNAVPFNNYGNSGTSSSINPNQSHQMAPRDSR